MCDSDATRLFLIPADWFLSDRERVVRIWPSCRGLFMPLRVRHRDRNPAASKQRPSFVQLFLGEQEKLAGGGMGFEVLE